MADLPDENWLPISGYHGLYSVSDLGRVRSHDRAIERKGSPYFLMGHILKPSDDGKGYMRVNLSRHSDTRVRYIHQLVLEAFIGPCGPGLECCHYNGDSGDNRLCNLRYDTRSANIADAKRHGTFPALERRPGAKLKRDSVVAIYTSSDPVAVLEKRYGIGPGVVRQIKMRETWASVTEDLPPPVWDHRPKPTEVEVAIALDRSLTRANAARILGCSIHRIKYIRKTRCDHIGGG